MSGSELLDLRYMLERKKGSLQKLTAQLDTLEKQKTELKRRHRLHERAQVIIRTVAEETQSQIAFHISNPATVALDAVFDDPYELSVQFAQRRNKAEVDIMFERDGELISPLTAAGVGAVDIACFALRVALWRITRPQTRPVLILDEPLKNLSSDLQEKAGEMLREISHDMGLQIIMISHVPELIEAADKVFNVRIKKGVSVVEDGNKME